MEDVSITFEIIMIVLFGASWPFNIVRAYRAKTAKGTSLIFLLLILIGYAAGMASKVFALIYYGGRYFTYLRTIAFSFYCINFIMLSVAIFVFFKNKRLDVKSESGKAAD